MSTQNEGDHSSPPILHFIKNSNTTELPSNQVKSSTVVDQNASEGTMTHNGDTQLSTENNDGDKPITVVSHSRRVHFPSDDSQLRIVSYTPDPLSNRPLLSLGVILQRYRATCQRLQLRPFNSLLDQLSTMDDGRKSFKDRLDCLKIINEKIDLKHIDAIEEILSRCRFHTLDLQSSIMDDITLTQLFDIIEYYESCTHINLSNHRSIGFQGYQSLIKYLRKSDCLERLDMNSMRFDENSMLGFTRALRSTTTLYELHVESCQLNGKILQKLIQNLRSCISLRELYLGDNRLQVQDSLLINDLIRTCGQFLYLLDLRSNSLQDGGMSHLASQFSQYDEHHTYESNLHKISFQGNQLTQQGVGFLAKSLLHNRTLRSINLSNNNITNEGLFLLRDALLTNRTVNELILRNCRLTDQAAIALAELIAESSTIQYLDLRENTIQASGICGMAIAIKNNKSLLQLDFDPIVSTPTSSLLNTNNIDRTGNSNSLLSLTNLRRMTTSLGSFTSSTPFQSTISGGGGGTRELLEQKARWMNDIAAICQRNVLIYEEKLRTQVEEQTNQTTNGIDRQNSTIVQSEDVELKDQTSTENEHSILSSIPKNSEEMPQVSEQSTNDKKPDQSIDTSLEDDHTTEQEINTSIEQPTTIPVDDNDTIEQSVDILDDKNPSDEQPTADSVDSDSPIDPTNQNSTISDLTDDIPDDDKRKFRHSDSIYLLRKKVKNDGNNTSDDDSQLSSIDEQMLDGV